MLVKIIEVCKHFYARFFLSKHEKKLLKSLAMTNFDGVDEKKKGIYVLMQMPEDHFFLIKFYLFTLVLKSRFNSVKIDFVQLSDHLSRRGKTSFLKNTFFYELKWRKMYGKLFNGEIVFNFNLKHATVSASEERQAQEIFSSYASKRDVLSTYYNKYHIGKLIYNYYLRVEGEPTIDIRSKVLYEILLNTIRSLNALEVIYSKNDYDIFVTSYLTYSVHGVPALVAFENKTKVLCFSAYDEFYHEAEPSFFSHVKDYRKYEGLKGKLREEDLAKAREKINDRLNGIIDLSTLYMPKSAYSTRNSDFAFEEEKNNVVIFLHCFFDSPHLYRDMIFPDFHDWLEFTLEVLSKEDQVNTYVKKHPGAMAANDVIVDLILGKFNTVKVIPKDYNNIQIATEMKPIAALTVYGTVAHELAYLGIPVICAGDNPHAGFNFHQTATTIKEYEGLLKQLSKSKRYSKEELSEVKLEVLRFVFLHNLYPFHERLSTREQSEYGHILNLLKEDSLEQFLKDFNPNMFDNLMKKVSRQLSKVL